MVPTRLRCRMVTTLLERFTIYRDRVFLVFPDETGRRAGYMSVRLALVLFSLATPTLGAGPVLSFDSQAQF